MVSKNFYQLLPIRISRLLSPATFCLMLSVLVISSCGGGGGTADPAPVDPISKVEISGAILVPGGTVTADNSLGLEPIANRPVSLFRVDNQGQVLGTALDTTTSDLFGNYVLLLPDNIAISSDLIVEATLPDNRPARAIVIDANTDITPITEYITSKIIADPDLNLSSLPATAVVELIEFVESLELTAQADMATTLASIAILADDQIEIDLSTLATTFNPQVQLSGLLSAPGDAPRNIAIALKPVGNTVINLYRIDNAGSIISSILATTTTDALGAYTLLLPAGLSLSSELILRAEVSAGVFLTALVVNVELNIDATSQYVYSQVVQESDLVLVIAPTTKVYALVVFVVSLNIAETSDLSSTLIAIDNSAGVEITIQINNLITVSSASLGFWGTSIWGGSSYH